MSTNDETLIEALRTAGHDEAADVLRDKSLANQLRDAGHTDLAESLKSKLGTAPVAAAEQPVSQREREAAAVVDALKRDTGIDLRPAEQTTASPAQSEAAEFLQRLKDASQNQWTSTPGLRDE